MTVLKALATLAVAGLIVTACRAAPSRDAESMPSVLATTSSAPAPDVSPLSGIKMPTGSTLTYGGVNSESWKAPMPRPEIIGYLDKSLPVGKPLKGLPWCSRKDDRSTAGAAQWDWTDGKNFIGVSVESNGEVFIMRGQDEATGRKGCDS